MIRWAVLGPTPGAFTALASPAAMASISRWGVVVERMARAALGPTPDTPMRSRKHRSSSSLKKPNSSRTSSRR